jgi:hypothetical protein
MPRGTPDRGKLSPVGQSTEMELDSEFVEEPPEVAPSVDTITGTPQVGASGK